MERIATKSGRSKQITTNRLTVYVLVSNYCNCRNCHNSFGHSSDGFRTLFGLREITNVMYCDTMPLFSETGMKNFYEGGRITIE